MSFGMYMIGYFILVAMIFWSMNHDSIYRRDAESFPLRLCGENIDLVSCPLSGILVKENLKEGRKMKHQLKTRVDLMDAGLSSAQFRF